MMRMIYANIALSAYSGEETTMGILNSDLMTGAQDWVWHRCVRLRAIAQTLGQPIGVNIWLDRGRAKTPSGIFIYDPFSHIMLRRDVISNDTMRRAMMQWYHDIPEQIVNGFKDAKYIKDCIIYRGSPRTHTSAAGVCSQFLAYAGYGKFSFGLDNSTNLHTDDIARDSVNFLLRYGRVYLEGIPSKHQIEGMLKISSLNAMGWLNRKHRTDPIRNAVFDPSRYWPSPGGRMNNMVAMLAEYDAQDVTMLWRAGWSVGVEIGQLARNAKEVREIISEHETMDLTREDLQDYFRGRDNNDGNNITKG